MLLQLLGAFQLVRIVLPVVLPEVFGIQDIQQKSHGQVGGVVPKILIDAFFCGQGQLAIRVSSQAVFAKTGQRKNRRAGAFALSGNLQHLRCFAGIGNDHGKISLGQTTSLISLVVQIVGDDHPFSDLQHLFPEGLGLIDSNSGGKRQGHH